MNLPNSITLARIGLVVVFAIAASMATPENSPAAYVVALSAFVVAAVSDFLDGYLARKLGLVTNFGKLADPLADKILVATAFVYISVAGLCPVWITALIIAREFLVTGIRQLAMENRRVIAADRLGKLKTIFQLAFCIDVLVWLTAPVIQDSQISGFWSSLAWIARPDSWLYSITLWGATVLTAWSGFSYTWHNRDLFAKSR